MRFIRWAYSRLLDRLPDWRIVELWCILTPQSWQDQNDGFDDRRGYVQRVIEQLTLGHVTIVYPPSHDAD